MQFVLMLLIFGGVIVYQLFRFAVLVREFNQVVRGLFQIKNHLPGRERVARLTNDWKSEYEITRNDIEILSREAAEIIEKYYKK